LIPGKRKVTKRSFAGKSLGRAFFALQKSLGKSAPDDAKPFPLKSLGKKKQLLTQLLKTKS